MTHPTALLHPDTHSAASDWAEEQTLRVAAAYSNPFRWRARRELANDFRRHMAATANVDLHLVELAYGDRPFEVSGSGDVQLRTRAELFHKENLLNIAVRSFPPGWKYGAIIDADFHFTRHDWALEAIHQLQHYDWVQLFSSYLNLTGETVLGQGHQPLAAMPGFAYNFVHRGNRLPRGYDVGGWSLRSTLSGMMGAKPFESIGAVGGAWAFRREAFDACGGLLDKCILGSGDFFMAFGLAGGSSDSFAIKQVTSKRGYTRDYIDAIKAWQENAARRIERNIGYVDGFAAHHWHGPIARRGYGLRDNILVDHQFEPTRDLSYDWQGVLQLTAHKPRLRDAIRAHFIERCEDLPHLEGI